MVMNTSSRPDCRRRRLFVDGDEVTPQLAVFLSIDRPARPARAPAPQLRLTPAVSSLRGIPTRRGNMTSQRKFVGAAMAVVAGLAALAPVSVALAQPYDSSYDQARRDYDAQYGPGAYDRYYGAQADQAYREDRRECRQEKKGNEVAGGLLGGIAGAVIGSNVARGGGRTGGAVIGGVGGAALGSNIAKGQTHCDE
jgi:hypothetical protein